MSTDLEPIPRDPVLADFEELLSNFNARHSNGWNSSFRVSTTRIDQVENWDAIFSDKILMYSLLFHILFMVSEIMISYVAFLYADVPNLPAMFAISMFFNILSAYSFPFIASTSMADNINAPFTDLHREVRGCQAFMLSIFVQVIALGLSICSTVLLFKSAPYIRVDSISDSRENISIDVTIMLECFQVISLQLLFLGLITTSLNYWFVRDRLLNYLNRIERSIVPESAADTEVPELYDQYLKTMRSKVSIPS